MLQKLNIDKIRKTVYIEYKQYKQFGAVERGRFKLK